jgi:hypothetical protein
VDDAGTKGVDETTTGVDEDNNEPIATTGVDATTELEHYVNKLGAELDQEIAALDTDYDTEPNEDDVEIDDSFEPINDDETNDIRADAIREQTSADHQAEEETDDEDSIDEDAPTQPLPKLRRNGTPSYAHLKGRDGDGALVSLMQPDEFKGDRHQSHIILQNIIMTQYNLKQGIKKIWGKRRKEAFVAELQQLYDRDVMTPVSKYDLTPAGRKGALRYLMFLKEKRCGTIKGRGCAYSRSQHDYMLKEEISSPTVATKALALTCIVDAIEKRDVATSDIPGAFLQSLMKGKVIMKLEGIMAEVILKIYQIQKNTSSQRTAKTLYTSYLRRPYMAPFKQHYCFGITCLRN